MTVILAWLRLGGMRIMLAPSAYYPHVGGIEEVTRQLAKALVERGHQIGVLTNRWPAGVPRSNVLDGIEVMRLRFPLPAKRLAPATRFIATSAAAAIALLRHVRRWHPDIVHVIGAGPQSVYLATLHTRLGAPLVFTGRKSASMLGGLWSLGNATRWAPPDAARSRCRHCLLGLRFAPTWRSWKRIPADRRT